MRMFTLDHIVINTQDRTDEAVAAYQRLGFTVQPRGYHTLGSLNHLMVFGDNYLEFLGYPQGAPPPQRPELPESPIGLLATVLKTSSADATRATLIAQGLPLRPVSALSRPVAIEGIEHTASFRVCRMERNKIPGTWFYYCQHETPELVFRPEWSQHANGVTGIVGASIELSDLNAALPQYAAALGCAIGNTRRTNTGAAFELPGFRLQLAQVAELPVGRSAMRSVTLRTRDLAALRRLLGRNGVAFNENAAGLVVAEEHAMGAALVFVEPTVA